MNRISFAIIFLCLFLSSCAKKFGSEIKIGLVSSFSNSYSSLGISMRNGVIMAIEEINKNGGADGHPIQITERDDFGLVDRSGPIMRVFLDEDKVIAVFGSSLTAVTDANTLYLQQPKIPQFITINSTAKVNELFKTNSENYNFRFTANDEVQAKVIVNAALKMGAKSIAVLSDDSDDGQKGREKLEAVLSSMKIKPVYSGKFKSTETDVSIQLTEAKKAQAEALLVWGSGPALAVVSKSMNRISWKVPMLGNWSLSMQNFITDAGKSGNGVLMPQIFIESDNLSPKQKAFVKLYAEKFNESPIASAVSAAAAYDSVYLLKLAIEQAKSTDGSKIKEALENLAIPYEGLTGTYTRPFSTTNHEGIGENNVKLGMIQDGKVIPAK